MSGRLFWVTMVYTYIYIVMHLFKNYTYVNLTSPMTQDRCRLKLFDNKFTKQMSAFEYMVEIHNYYYASFTQNV